MVTVHPLVPFFNAHGVAVRAAGIIEPGSFIESVRLGGEGVVIQPLADRIAPPPWLFNVFGKVSPVGPYDSPFLVKQVQNDDVFRSLHDPARPEIMQNDAREPLRITTGHWIIR